MTHTFVAFIDEAGDEGFKIVPRPAKYSSEWFIMSAVIVRSNMTQLLDSRLTDFFKVYGEKAFHFRDARHSSRIAYLDALKWSPFRVVAVAAHKEAIGPSSTLRTVRHQLYHYMSKLLMERISWYCHDVTPADKSAVVRLIFAQRGQLKVSRIVNHLSRLKRGGNHSIRWRTIDINQVDVIPCEDLTGLQIADAAAGSLEQALELSRHSTTEHRYMKMWAHKYYRRSDKCDGVGLKAFPCWPDDNPFDDAHGRQHWRHRFA